MPRHPRLELPAVPMHITQRGVNRAATFVDDVDRWHYLTLLRQQSIDFGVAVHAYVLMGNHVHLLTSAAQCGATSRALRRVTQCYVQAFNRRHRRTGTLWEGRFKSCLVNSAQYLLQVYRYIELNPVRAAMVESPELYAWSSVHANLGRWRDPLITPHADFLALANEDALRHQCYAEWLKSGIGTDQLEAIRRHITQERAFGDERFQAMVEKTLNRPAVPRPRGRPRRSL